MPQNNMNMIEILNVEQDIIIWKIGKKCDKKESS